MANIGEVWASPTGGYFLVLGTNGGDSGQEAVFLPLYGWLPADLAAQGWQKMQGVPGGGWTPVNPPVGG